MTGVDAPVENNSVIAATKVVKRFRVRQSWGRRTTVTAVDGVTFSVRRGETVALVGESGSGKSTIGKILLGLLSADSGDVQLGNQSAQTLLRRDPNTYRRSVQIIFQNPIASFNPMLTIGTSLLDNMRLREDLNKEEREAEAVRLLEAVELTAEYMQRYPSEMSGGQLQRVSISRALASNPQVIFLDEPTSALDMSIRGQVVNLLRHIQRERQLAFILVSHDLSLVRAMADYVLVMYLGQVVEEGPVGEVLRAPRHPYTQGLLAATFLGRDGLSQSHYTTVRGEVLQMPADYIGCRLTQRCPFEEDRCRSNTQMLAPVAESHLVRCWKAAEAMQVLLEQQS